MKIKEFAKKYGREINNNFAAAVYNENSLVEIERLLFAEESSVDKDDLKHWGIEKQEWIDGIRAAYNEKSGDLGKKK